MITDCPGFSDTDTRTLVPDRANTPSRSVSPVHASSAKGWASRSCAVSHTSCVTAVILRFSACRALQR
jgi:hypothetical protein